MPQLTALEDFVEDMVSILEATGLNRMSSRVLVAILVSEDGSLTSRQLADNLGVSGAAISNAVRQLEMLRFVRRRRPAGQRMENFEVVDSLWEETTMEQSRVFGRLATTLDHGSAAVPAGSAAQARLSRSRDFFQQLADELPHLIDRANSAS